MDEGPPLDATPPSTGRDPDLRHVRYVALSPAPPGRRPSGEPLATRLVRGGLFGAFAGGTLSGQLGRPLWGLAVGGALGLASVAWRQARSTSSGRPFALVPWGLLVDGEHDLTAVRWSGVRTLDVRYRAAADGSVHARVTVDSVAGSLVGFSSDAVDFGALAGDLAGVTEASARPLAMDLAGELVTEDGEPFVDRLLQAARALVEAEASTLGLEPLSYRDGRVRPSETQQRVAVALGRIGERAPPGLDPWALVAAVAGELRLGSFASRLARLTNAPNPCVSAIARAALGRVRRGGGGREPSSANEPADAVDADDALSWFVPPDELGRLGRWRDAE